MGRAIALREDFDGVTLRRLAKGSKDVGQSRRLLALAEIYDGSRRRDAARIGDVGLQVTGFNSLSRRFKDPAPKPDGCQRPPSIGDRPGAAVPLAKGLGR